MPPQAVAFDLYDTLLDVEPPGTDAVRERIFRELGIRDAAAASLRMQLARRGGLERMLETIARTDGATPAPAAVERAASLLRDAVRRVRPFDDAAPALRSLRDRGLRLAVISNVGEGFADAWLASPLAPLVDVSVLSCDEGIRKPEAGIFSLAATRLGLSGPPWPMVMVGDRLDNDVEAALDAGCAGARLIDRSARPDPVLPPGALRLRSLSELASRL